MAKKKYSIRTAYQKTGKVVPGLEFMMMLPGQQIKHMAYQYLAERIADRFPDGYTTMYDIWFYITSKYGISYAETKRMVKAAMEYGYLTKSLKKKEL